MSLNQSRFRLIVLFGGLKIKKERSFHPYLQKFPPFFQVNNKDNKINFLKTVT